MQPHNKPAELWAILPEALATLSRLSENAPPAVSASLFSAPPQVRIGATALISIRGPVMNRATFFSQLFGFPSAEGIALQLRQALADSKTKTILLDIDSPGGAVAGNAELAEEIRAARKEKTIIAQVNPLAASAAYWLAAQASEVVVTPTSEVGSIGVFVMHVDESGALKKEGLAVSLIAAGKFKTEGNPYEPLGGAAKEALQKRVDSAYDMFVDAVAAGRGVGAQKVLDNFGGGRLVNAGDALEAGMADRIGTLDETIARSGRNGLDASTINTIRDFESFLRSEGFARGPARAIASGGFHPELDEREEGDAEEAVVLDSLADALSAASH